MPAKSVAQRRLMGMAEHNPGMVSKKNRGVLKMSKNQLSDYASTSEGGLPVRIRQVDNKLKRKKIK
jgi:hypothetical protein